MFLYDFAETFGATLLYSENQIIVNYQTITYSADFSRLTNENRF